MDIKKLTIFSILTIVASIISLLIIRIILKKQRKRSTTRGAIHLAFAVSFIGCVAGATLLRKRSGGSRCLGTSNMHWN